jgi:oligopeptide transport system permease protein
MSQSPIVRVDYNIEKIKQQKEDELFYFVDNKTVSSERITAPRYSYWRSVFRIFFKKKINIVILFLFVVILLMSFVFPIFFPYNEFENVLDTSAANLTPAEAISHFGFSIKWIFGTGTYGNSNFYGVWSSARTSLLLALICGMINMSLGVLIGAFWGYSKTMDSVLNVIYNIVSNVPYVLLISILVYVIGAGFWPFVFALTVTGWLGIAYFFRTQVLIIRDREYNLASRCLGTRLPRVVSRNVLPYLTSVIVTVFATEIPSYVSMEVFLTYIGIGLKSSTPSLGHLIQISEAGWTTYPWPFWVPVAVSSSITIILYVLGQNLADASDPRSHMQ